MMLSVFVPTVAVSSAPPFGVVPDQLADSTHETASAHWNPTVTCSSW